MSETSLEYFSRSALAAADLRTKQYVFMRAAAAGTVNQSSQGNGNSPATLIGVLANKPNSGQAATIIYGGEYKVIAGGAITVNRWITSNGSGKAAAAVSGDNVIGFALEAAVADGDHIRCILMPTWRLTGPES